MSSAFNKEIVRSITRSAGRFAAILLISLLGAGVYAGLRMAAPDMRIDGDTYFDATNLYDVGVMTTLGVDDETISLVRGVEGVGNVMPAYRTNAMVLAGENSYAASIESFPLAAAKDSDTSDGVHAVSQDDSYLNRLLLMEGKWPSDAKECVVGIDAAHELGIAPGDVVEVAEEVEDDADPALKTTVFTVSGLVNAPTYASSSMLGTTSLGTGELELYLYVPEGAFDEELPYALAYASVPAAKGAVWDSSAYEREVNTVKERLNELAPQLAKARYAAVKDEAQQELDDAQDEYRTERADAEQELDDARVELDDAHADLEDAQHKLEDARAELGKAQGDLNAARKKLSDGQKNLASARRELQKSKVKLDASQKQLEESRAQIEQMRQAIVAGVAADAATRAAYEKALAAYEQGLAQYNKGLEQYTQGVKKYEKGVAEYNAGKKEYERGLKKYNDGLADYQKGKQEFEDGIAEYEDGEVEYADGVSEATEKFADAEREIADAQADIDNIEYPTVYILDRSKNAGVSSLKSDAQGIVQIALFLPFMFFLVAALVSLTSMTRMVEEERQSIGTHKALGYGKARITSKYLIYGALASGVGSVVGVLALGKLLPWFILVSYGVSYAIPVYDTPIDLVIMAKAVGLSVGITLLATWWAAASTLREKPAALMVARVPKAGKRIFLERVTPLWSKMSFSHKVTARNLLRYKRRFFMAVLGVAGCTALLLVGFGLRDAIGGIVSTQYETLINYDVAVRMDDDLPENQRDRALAVLESDDVESYLEVADFTMIAQGPTDDMRVEVVVPKDASRLGEFVTLRERASAEPLELQGDAVVLTEKAATVMGVSVGDELKLFDEDDIGDKTGDGRRFIVGGITENYLGHYAYMLPQGYKTAFGEDPVYDMVYAKLAAGADGGSVSDALLAIKDVNTVSFVADKITTYEGMLDVMNKLIFIIVGLSAALAFVVLYNLTNINITERVREIATLKVLGFTRGEVNAYIFREVMVMTLIGALLGCVLGVPLTFYIAQAAETANMMFGRSIEPLSFVLSFLLTMGFAVLVAFTMRGKLVHVNMVESLKSNE